MSRTNRRASTAPGASKPTDPLGRVLRSYSPHPFGFLFLMGLGLLGGAPFAIFPLFLKMHKALLISGCAIAALIMLVCLVCSVRNFKRRLDLHQNGVRFFTGDSSVEMDWDQIFEIRLGKTDFSGVGPFRAMSRDEDSYQAGRPLMISKFTFFDVSIVDLAGQSIHLSQVFMATLSFDETAKLVHNLHRGAGLEPGEQRV